MFSWKYSTKGKNVCLNDSYNNFKTILQFLYLKANNYELTIRVKLSPIFIIIIGGKWTKNKNKSFKIKGALYKKAICLFFSTQPIQFNFVRYNKPMGKIYRESNKIRAIKNLFKKKKNK